MNRNQSKADGELPDRSQGFSKYKEIKRGDVYYADLRPVMGSEQGGVRPVVVIQNNVGNHYSPTVIVAAITSSRKRWMPTHVCLPRQKGLRRISYVLLEQIRTIDRRRLKEHIGTLDNRAMAEIDKAIEVSMGLSKAPKTSCWICSVSGQKILRN